MAVIPPKDEKGDNNGPRNYEEKIMSVSITQVQPESFFVFELTHTLLLRHIVRVQGDKAYFRQYEFKLGQKMKINNVSLQNCRRRQIVRWATRMATAEEIASLKKETIWQIYSEVN